jgi:hypothetical protein
VSAFLAQGATRAAIRECPSVVPLRGFGEQLLDRARTRTGAENSCDHPTTVAAACLLAPGLSLLFLGRHLILLDRRVRCPGTMLSPNRCCRGLTSALLMS